MRKRDKKVLALVLVCFCMVSCSSVAVKNDAGVSVMPVKESRPYSAEKQGERLLVKGVSGIVGLGLGLTFFNEDNYAYRIAVPLAAISASNIIYDIANGDYATDSYKTGFWVGMAVGTAAALCYAASNNFFGGAGMNSQILAVSVPVSVVGSLLFGHSCGSVLSEFFDVTGIKF